MSSDEARARRSLVAPIQNSPEGDTLVVIDRTHWYGGNGREEESRPHALLVLATNGRWQPAKSLFEYVQQNVIETCASAIEDEAAWNYENSAGYGDHGLDKLLSFVTPDFAKCIVERRRTQERSIRTLRVVAQRANVPVECARHIEAYAALSARDAIPCQRAQLPAFMQRLVEKYWELKWDSDLSYAFVTSGFMGSDEIWKGSFDDYKHGRRLTGPRELHNNSRKAWTLFPRKLQQQYDNMRSSFGYSHRDDTSWTPGMHLFVERPPGPAWTPEGG